MGFHTSVHITRTYNRKAQIQIGHILSVKLGLKFSFGSLRRVKEHHLSLSQIQEFQKLND